MSGSRLAATFRTLTAISKHAEPVVSPSIANARLPKVAEKIFIDRVQRKPAIDEDLLRKWKEFVSESKLPLLTDREIRRLGWEPSVTLSKDFLVEIERRDLPLRRSLLKGLIYSILSGWSSEESKPLQSFLFEKSKLDSTNHYLKKISSFALSPSGPSQTANLMIEGRTNLQKTISELFGIAASTTAFANYVLNSAIEVGYKKVLSNNLDDRKWFYNEILPYVNKETLLRCLEKAVSAIDEANSEIAKEEFKRFVLFHPNLGDPRLPGFEGNWPKEREITRKVIEWLSQSDIRFFFELFIENKSDQQGRKQFWLKYAHLAKGTRVIVSSFDQKRLARQIIEMKQKSGSSNLFADLKDSSEKSTAFMIDFGGLIVVEFSLANHACYYYRPQSAFKFSERSLFWNTNSFSISDLKNKRLCSSPLTHRDGWEKNFMNILAGFGLRPKPERRGY